MVVRTTSDAENRRFSGGSGTLLAELSPHPEQALCIGAGENDGGGAPGGDVEAIAEAKQASWHAGKKEASNCCNENSYTGHCIIGSSRMTSRDNCFYYSPKSIVLSVRGVYAAR